MRDTALKTNKTAKKGSQASTQLYRQNVAAVDSYATDVAQTPAPTLQNPPSGYGDFQNAYSQAQSRIVAFTNKVLELLLSIPGAIVQDAKGFQSDIDTASQEAQALQQNPDDGNTKKSLLNHLSLLLGAVQQSQGVVSNFLNGLQDFQDNKLPDAAAQLTRSSNQALQFAQNAQTDADNSALWDFAQSLSGLAEEAQELVGSAQQIADSWQDMSIDLQQVVNDVNQATADTTANQFGTVSDDLNTTSQHVDMVAADAEDLDVNVNANLARR